MLDEYGNRMEVSAGMGLNSLERSLIQRTILFAKGGIAGSPSTRHLRGYSDNIWLSGAGPIPSRSPGTSD